MIIDIINACAAVIAILQPWIIRFYNNHAKKIQLNFIHSSKIQLYYNRDGAYVYLGGVIRAKNKAAIVNDIMVKVIRKKDKAELLLDWSFFNSPTFQFTANNPLYTGELARAFKVESDGLYPVFITFKSTDINESNKLNEIYRTVDSECPIIMSQHFPINQVKNELSKTSSYKSCHEELLSNLYWKEGDYLIELIIIYNDNQSQQFRYKFNIDNNEAKEFKNNIDRSLQSVVDQAYGVYPFFFVAQKDFITENGK